ncbi:MAG: hypothetical protein HOO86_02355 [Bacteroidales bacterium]|nr:hypothetical protein [Bacteroidales bacterium]
MDNEKNRSYKYGIIFKSDSITGNVRKAFFIVLLLTFTSLAFSQEFYVGGFAATNWKVETSSEILGFGANIEYRPNKSVLSFNSDISRFWVEKSPITTFPLSLKLIIGNKIRICPTFGGFIRTNENYGYSAGISVDYRVMKKVSLYIKTEYMRDYWKAENITWHKYNYVGGKKINDKCGYSIWINLGIKFSVLKTKN